VADCEELVGVAHRRWWGSLKNNLSVHRLCIRALRAYEANNQVSVKVSIRNCI